MRWPFPRAAAPAPEPAPEPPPRVFFSIPLRPNDGSADWATIERLLGDTLRSVLAQDDSDFAVVIAGHDRPDVAELADPRVTFLAVDIERPVEPQARQIDQMRKRRIAAAEIGRRGGGYIMVVDADDLVDHGIVSFVKRDRHPVGYMVRAGYLLDDAAGMLGLLPGKQRVQQLWANCGTCAILRFDAHELPPMQPDRVDYKPSRSLYEALVGHRLWETALMLRERYPATLPFRGVIYRMNTGANFSEMTRQSKTAAELLAAPVDYPVDMSVKRERFDG